MRLSGDLPLDAQKDLRFLYWAFIPFAGLGVVLSGSRAGVICLGVAVLLLMFTSQGGGGWKIKAILAIFLLAGAYLAVRIGPEALWERLATTTEDRSFGGRSEIWKGGFQTFLEHPIVGVGAGAFYSTGPGEEHFHAHNTYLSILVEFGILARAWPCLSGLGWLGESAPSPRRNARFGQPSCWSGPLGARRKLRFAQIDLVFRRLGPGPNGHLCRPGSKGKNATKTIAPERLPGAAESKMSESYPCSASSRSPRDALSVGRRHATRGGGRLRCDQNQQCFCSLVSPC